MIEWNLFAEGTAENVADIPLLDADFHTVIIYIKGLCEVCQQEVWLKLGTKVCKNCTPFDCRVLS